MQRRKWRFELNTKSGPLETSDFGKIGENHQRAGHKGLVKKKKGVGRSREGVGHEVLSLVQGVGRAIFSYP